MNRFSTQSHTIVVAWISARDLASYSVRGCSFHERPASFVILPKASEVLWYLGLPILTVESYASQRRNLHRRRRLSSETCTMGKPQPLGI